MPANRAPIAHNSDRKKTPAKMTQRTENELTEYLKANPVGWGTKTTIQAPDPPPPIITKKWLCVRFQCQYPGGNFNYTRLYRLVLTPDVIRQIGMTPETIRGRTVREFDAVTSRKLKQVLDL